MYDPNKDVWYNANREYAINTTIYEYDIMNAGLNMLRNTIGEKKYMQLSCMPKMDRNVLIGKMIRSDSSLAEILKKGFTSARKWFVETNQLQDNDIIAVKKDALFVTKVCPHMEYNDICFRIKNTYSSYIRFDGNIEVYYTNGNIDIKGLGEYAENIHRLYMTDFIKSSIKAFESKDKRYVRKTIRFLDEYKKGSMVEYYPQYKPSGEYDPGYNIIHVIIPLIQLGMKVI